MSGAKQATVEQTVEVRRLVYLGFRPAQIYRELQRTGFFKDHSLSKRTIERMAQEFAPLDSSGPWSLADADPDEARLVLPVLVDIYERTEGRIWLSRNLAEWIVKLRRAVPHLPTDLAYLLARAYQSAEGGDTRALDLMVGMQSGTWDVAGARAAKLFQVMMDNGLRSPALADIMADIFQEEFDRPIGTKESPDDSNLTAKPADDLGLGETNRTE